MVKDWSKAGRNGHPRRRIPVLAICGPIAGQTSLETLVEPWLKSWSKVVKHWSNAAQDTDQDTGQAAGQTLARRARKLARAGRGSKTGHFAGQTRVKRGSNAGQTLVKRGSNAGKIRVKRGSKNGHFLAESGSNKSGPNGRIPSFAGRAEVGTHPVQHGPGTRVKRGSRRVKNWSKASQKLVKGGSKAGQP